MNASSPRPEAKASPSAGKLGQKYPLSPTTVGKAIRVQPAGEADHIQLAHIARVANDRDGVLDLLTVTMREFSISVRWIARMIITGTCDEAVKAGNIREHRLDGIELADSGTKHSLSEVQPST